MKAKIYLLLIQFRNSVFQKNFVILQLNYQPATVIVLEKEDIRINTRSVNVWLTAV